MVLDGIVLKKAKERTSTTKIKEINVSLGSKNDNLIPTNLRVQAHWYQAQSMSCSVLQPQHRALDMVCFRCYQYFNEYLYERTFYIQPITYGCISVWKIINANLQAWECFLDHVQYSHNFLFSFPIWSHFCLDLDLFIHLPFSVSGPGLRIELAFCY